MDILTVFGWVLVKAAGCLLLIACVELGADLYQLRRRRKQSTEAMKRWVG